ncbi:hypothetical protein [Nitrosopumilus sp.]|uniref:hypothetical protein n=1 Tax=Nitrosopumilus sp. TaxID=2024843 RepID=UPI00292CAC37|nr:hypothetical protein [Nitrosopumilus sp.]
MDNNTTKVLLAAIPSGAFVIIVALVIFGLSPGDCIEIEAPGGGKVTKCKPVPDSVSIVSADQINALETQIEELKSLQDTQQQQRLTSLKQEGVIEETPSSFMTASSVFEEKQGLLSEQLQFLSSNEASVLSQKISSDNLQINTLNKVADLITEGKNFSWAGQWKVTGTIGVFGLSYEGQISFNDDGSYESQGTLDGKPVSGDGTYLINGQLGTCTLSPSDSDPTQYSFVDIGDNSFIMWSPLDFEKLEFRKIIS